MAWYWVVAISLVWMVLLYTWSCIASRGALPSNKYGESVDLAIYLAIFLIWPAIILIENLIHVEWYIWVLLIVEAICLFFLSVELGESMNKPPHRRGWKMTIRGPMGTLMTAFLMVIAPLGLVYLVDYS